MDVDSWSHSAFLFPDFTSAYPAKAAGLLKPECGRRGKSLCCCLVSLLSDVKGPVLSAHVDSLALLEYLVSNLDHQSKVSHLLTLDARLGRSYKHFILFSPEQNNFDSLTIPTESKRTSWGSCLGDSVRVTAPGLIRTSHQLVRQELQAFLSLCPGRRGFHCLV